MFKTLKKILQFLNSQADPVEIAIGAILGLFFAFLSPSLFNVFLLFLVALLLNCNFGVFLFCAGVFKIFTVAVDPLGDVVGRIVLSADFLRPLWKLMADIPVISLTSFNNSVIMGNFIIGIILTPVIWLVTIKTVEFYRKNLRDKVKKFKIIQILTGADIVEGVGK